MSEFCPDRGDVRVDLGDLGEVVCRPGLRALAAIDSYHSTLTISDLVVRLISHPSLNDVITIIYETHLDAEPEKRLSRRAIGEAVLSVGMDSLYGACSELLSKAWSKKALEAAEEGRDEDDQTGDGYDPGNGERAVETGPSPPVNGSA